MEMSKSTVAANIKKSSMPRNQPEQTSLQRLEVAVACQSAIQPETTSFGDLPSAAIPSLLSIVLALQYEFPSNDAWELSLAKSKGLAAGFGVSEQDFEKILVKLEALRKKVRSRNPLHEMF